MVVGRLVGLEMVLVELEHFLVVLLTLFIVMMISLVVQRRPGVIVQGNVPVPWNFPRLQNLMLCKRRSLLVSKTITTFARYPGRRPAGVVPAGDGSLDVDQLWGLLGTPLLLLTYSAITAYCGSRYL